MHAKLLVSALVAAAGFAATPSFADPYHGGEVGSFETHAPKVSYLTRAAVQAATLQAARNGSLPATGEGMAGARAAMARTAAPSQVTRQQVREQAAYAVRNGLTVGGEV